MNYLEQKIRELAIEKVQKVALYGEGISGEGVSGEGVSGEEISGEKLTLNYQQLLAEIEATNILLPHTLNKAEQKSYAILMDNHPAWAVLDLALMFSQQCSIALPKFFSTEQLYHALLDSQADYLIIDEVMSEQLSEALNASIEATMVSRTKIIIASKELQLITLKMPLSEQKVRPHVAKITYTSGTTDQPKGVLLSEQSILAKTQSLAEASGANSNDHSLSILPLSTLLENIAGLYVPLSKGGSVSLLSPQRIGISGSSQIDAQQLMMTINTIQPTAFIIIPQLLQMFIKLLSSGYQLPASIRFIAMGGAPISLHLLKMAEQLHIPVFEGYGLSEAASVVAVNTPQAHKIGSVGQVLKTHSIKIVAEQSSNNASSDKLEDELKAEIEGEIFIKEALFNGYLGEQAIDSQAFYATGDIGKLDSEGFLYITGRKKNIINTSYGRNISPEWIEKELEAIPDIAQSVIVGHAKPYLIAIIVLRNTQLDNSGLSALLNTLNEKLPDYARVNDFIISDTPFTIANNQLTGTGRPRRREIINHFNKQIEALYAST